MKKSPSYAELLLQLFSLPKRRSQTFPFFQQLDQKLAHPHKAFRTVHVGGTNGKGSVATKIAAGLQEEGFRVGLYTSPHISSFRERIQINRQMISEEAIREHLSLIFPLMNEPLSFFDVTTALAFRYFQEEKVGWAVVEVGIGGRLDATNVITPELAVVTSIGYDHTELLGDTLEKIAQEKGAIAKEGIPFLVGPQAAPFFPKAESIPAMEEFYDAENSRLAAAALHRLNISSSSIASALQYRPLCRFEIIGNTILDVAHNPDGFRRLIQALSLHFPQEKFHFIVAFSKDKDWRTCLELIQPYAEKISFVNSHPRFVHLGEGSIQEALQYKSSGSKVVCGSFYLMAEARRTLGILEPLDPEQVGG